MRLTKSILRKLIVEQFRSILSEVNIRGLAASVEDGDIVIDGQRYSLTAKLKFGGLEAPVKVHDLKYVEDPEQLTVVATAGGDINKDITKPMQPAQIGNIVTSVQAGEESFEIPGILANVIFSKVV